MKFYFQHLRAHEREMHKRETEVVVLAFDEGQEEMIYFIKVF